MNLDDISLSPRFDNFIHRLGDSSEQFRSIAERLHSWAICDADKKEELNSLRHSSERVLDYWKKYDPIRGMSTNSLEQVFISQAAAIARH